MGLARNLLISLALWQGKVTLRQILEHRRKGQAARKAANLADKPLR
jgi:hypothetical protein